MTILLSLAKVLKVRFVFVFRFFFSLPITSDFEENMVILNMGWGPGYNTRIQRLRMNT